MVLHTKEFGRLVDGNKHRGKETPPKRAADVIYSDMPLGHPLLPSRAYRASMDALSPCCTQQHGPKPCGASVATSHVPVQARSVSTDFDPR